MNIIIGSSTGDSSYWLSKGSILSIMLIALAVVITFYVLRSVGLYKLAKKQGVENAFLAWIPCVWMFIACKIVGKARIFGTAAEKFAVWACVLFSVAVIIPVVYYGFTIAPYVFRAIQSEDVVMIVSDGTLYVSPELSYSSGLNKFLDIIGVFGNVLRLVEIFITVSVYIALFKKFWPQHYILAAVLSFFGLFGVFAFVIRNNQPVDFNEYIRRRYYNAGFPPYGGYGQGGYNPYNNGGNGYGAPNQGNSEDKESADKFAVCQVDDRLDNL